MLQLDPKNRFSAEDCLNHIFFDANRKKDNPEDIFDETPMNKSKLLHLYVYLLLFNLKLLKRGPMRDSKITSKNIKPVLRVRNNLLDISKKEHDIIKQINESSQKEIPTKAHKNPLDFSIESPNLKKSLFESSKQMELLKSTNNNFSKMIGVNWDDILEEEEKSIEIEIDEKNTSSFKNSYI